MRTKKEKLINYVDNSGENIISTQSTLQDNAVDMGYEINEDDIKELDSRWEEYLSGKSTTYTLEEAMSEINTYLEDLKKNVL